MSQHMTCPTPIINSHLSAHTPDIYQAHPTPTPLNITYPNHTHAHNRPAHKDQTIPILAHQTYPAHINVT